MSRLKKKFERHVGLYKGCVIIKPITLVPPAILPKDVAEELIKGIDTNQLMWFTANSEAPRIIRHA